MTTQYGEGPPAQRTCAAADRTGHAMLHTLYQQSLKARAEFFIEFFALDLLMDQDGTCCGVMAWDLSTGQLHRYRAKRSEERRVGKECGSTCSFRGSPVN